VLDLSWTVASHEYSVYDARGPDIECTYACVAMTAHVHLQRETGDVSNDSLDYECTTAYDVNMEVVFVRVESGSAFKFVWRLTMRRTEARLVVNEHPQITFGNTVFLHCSFFCVLPDIPEHR
jgi:hypothetical protein